MKLTAIICILLYVATWGYSATVSKSETVRKGAIIAAIIQVESNGNPRAHNKSEDAVGILQITPIMVAEVNRIAGTRFKLSDRWDAHCSLLMFAHYTNHYTPCWTPELVARRWNGGPRGDKKQSTLKYWEKVEKKL